MKKKIILVFLITIIFLGLSSVNALDSYEEDYGIEYLIKNYNVVTFGKRVYTPASLNYNSNLKKGSVTNVYSVGGPVLIAGDFSDFSESTVVNYGISSYIKGNVSGTGTIGKKYDNNNDSNVNYNKKYI